MKFKFLKPLAHKLLPTVVSILQRVLFLTCKNVYILPKNEMPSPAIWVSWHGQILMLPYIYHKIRPIPRKTKAYVVVSEHAHGDMIIKAIKRFKLDFIRGSSRRGAVKVLIKAIDALKKGEDVCITPDGPKGPLHSVSDGVVALSLKFDTPVVALGWCASSFWQLKSWDATKIPKPFSTITYRVSEPFSLKGLEKDEAKKIVRQKLMECMNE